MRILVSGGAGFIGSHTIVELLTAGYTVVSGDNYCNSQPLVYDAISKISGCQIGHYELDFCDEASVLALFEQESFDSVIHFAGLKAVGESVQKPLEYYCNNILSAIVLCKACTRFNVKRFIFSSSATVYGDPQFLPLTEEHPVSLSTNPYGNTKFFIEQILRDTHAANSDLDVVLLRYFNPVGAHRSGLIGENPHGIPNNLMPYVSQVASGARPKLSVFGNDYNTPDGTGVRDFIHVVDLAKGHIAALESSGQGAAVRAYNLGTGKGTSVLELIKKFEEINGVAVPFEFAPRRQGDVAACWADPSLALRELGWKAELGIDEMVRDSWLFQRMSSELAARLLCG